MLNPSFALAELSTTDCGEIRDGVALRLAAAACGEIRDGVALRLAAAALLGGWRWRWPHAWRSVEVADRSMIPAAMIEGLAAYILWRY